MAIFAPLGILQSFRGLAINATVAGYDQMVQSPAQVALHIPADFVVSVLGMLFSLHLITLLYIELVEPGRARLPGDDAPEMPTSHLPG